MEHPVAIVGVGEAPVSKVSGRPALDLAAQAALAALEDAGLTLKEIDGLLLELPLSEHHHMPAAVFLEYLGIRPKVAAAYSLGGATPHAMAIHAAALIRSGRCNAVLVVDADSRSSRFRQEDPVAAMMRAASDQEEIEVPFGPTVPGRYALIARRHMHCFGTTPHQLAAVAVAQRYHASLNPDAIYRNPIDVEDVLNSPMIADPLHLLDFCMVSDWGTAFIVGSASVARSTRKLPVWLIGFGEAQQGYNLASAPDLTAWPIRQSGQEAFAMAGLRPDHIHVAEIYDSFTITVLIALEDLGFCPKGEGGAFVASGATRLGGRLPVNTHGGQLSYSAGHGQYIVEAVRQLRQEAGARQVAGARYALSQGTAALCSASFTLILAS